MRKFMILIIIILSFMLAGCVDYAAVSDTFGAEEATPEPTIEPEMMVSMSTYEALEGENDELRDHIAQLEEDQKNADEQKMALINEIATLDDALKQIELGMYRSIISNSNLEIFFGGVIEAEETEDDLISVQVNVLNQSNEKFDSSLYTRDDIEKINENLSFEQADEKPRDIEIDSDVLLRYNGTSYPSLDDGFYAYLADQIVQAEVAASKEDDEEDETMIYSPVYIFVTLNDKALMVLEK